MILEKVGCISHIVRLVQILMHGTYIYIYIYINFLAEILTLQSKFEEDKKRIQQLRAARKFRPY